MVRGGASTMDSAIPPPNFSLIGQMVEATYQNVHIITKRTGFIIKEPTNEYCIATLFIDEDVEERILWKEYQGTLWKVIGA